MSAETTISHDEAEIRKLVEDWRSALCAKDLDRMLAHYAPDVLFFDVVPPYQHKGADAYRRTWENCFPYLPESIDSEMRDLSITVHGDGAYAHCLQRITDKNTGRPATCNWVRVTVCYQRMEGKWKVVHEHVSVPFDPMTSKAAFIDTP
jgi:uncharacterized protein (TIGR02246 family)